MTWGWDVHPPIENEHIKVCNDWLNVSERPHHVAMQLESKRSRCKWEIIHGSMLLNHLSLFLKIRHQEIWDHHRQRFQGDEKKIIFLLPCHEIRFLCSKEGVFHRQNHSKNWLHGWWVKTDEWWLMAGGFFGFWVWDNDKVPTQIVFTYVSFYSFQPNYHIRVSLSEKLRKKFAILDLLSEVLLPLPVALPGCIAYV